MAGVGRREPQTRRSGQSDGQVVAGSSLEKGGRGFDSRCFFSTVKGGAPCECEEGASYENLDEGILHDGEIR